MAKPAIPYLFTEDNLLYGRTVYIVSKRHKMVPLLKPMSHWAESNDKFLFSVSDEMNSTTLAHANGTVRFTTMSYKMYTAPLPPIKVVSFWSDTLIVDTLAGTFIWKIWNESVRDIIREYLTQFAAKGWEQSLEIMPLQPQPVISALNRVYYDFIYSRLAKAKTLIPDPFQLPWVWLERGHPNPRTPKCCLHLQKEWLKDIDFDGILVRGELDYDPPVPSVPNPKPNKVVNLINPISSVPPAKKIKQ